MAVTLNASRGMPFTKGMGAQKEPQLPALREDLRLHEGPRAYDGSPTWIIEDPVRDRFFQLGYRQ